MRPEYVVMGALCALIILWIFYRLYVQEKAKKAYQAACVHNDKIVYAWDDPRWPVAICQICGRQEPRKALRPIYCPHCGKDTRVDKT